MASEVRELLVFIGSPGDLAAERDAVRRAAEAVNYSMSGSGVQLKVVGWEQVQPAFGRPQELINPYVDACDIFVGLLNRRWGSATGTHSSGFEEEFRRAVSRRSSYKTPSIGIFFREVDRPSLDDPGLELSKVLEFKHRVREDHLLLYKEFQGEHDLELYVTQFFTQLLFQEVREAVPRSPESNAADSSPRLPSSTPPMDEAQTQVSGVFAAFVDLLHGQRGDEFRDSDRLLMFALAISRETVLLPIHAVNRLYGRRRELTLTRIEGELWLKTFAADITRSESLGSSRVVPAWGALFPEENGLERAADMLTDVLRGEDSQVVTGVFVLLRQLRARPSSLWEDSPERVDRWVKVMKADHVPEGVFAYIAAMATEQDVPLLVALQQCLDSTTVAVELKAICAYANGDIEEVAQLAANRSPLPTWLSQILCEHVDKLSDQLLEKLIFGAGEQNETRITALNELMRRDGEVIASVLQEILANDRFRLREAVLSEIDNVDKGAVKLALSKLDKSSINDAVIARVRAVVSDIDELREEAAKPIIGISAWEALAWRNGEEFAAEARDILDSDLASQDSALKILAESERGAELVDFVRAAARRAALELLIRLPEIARDSADIDRARKELSRDSWVTKAAAERAVIKLGTSADAQILLEASRTPHMLDDRRTLLKAATRLGDVNVAKALAASDDPEEAFIGLTALIEKHSIEDTDLINSLYSQHASVRLRALAGLQSRWTKARLVQLASEYPAGPNSYYYNIMAELDRILYAPEEIASLPIAYSSI